MREDHISSISRFVLAGLSDSLLAPNDSVASRWAGRASPSNSLEKSSGFWMVRCLSSWRFMAYSPSLLVRAFFHRSRFRLSVAPPFGLECLTSLADVVAYYALC